MLKRNNPHRRPLLVDRAAQRQSALARLGEAKIEIEKAAAAMHTKQSERYNTQNEARGYEQRKDEDPSYAAGFAKASARAEAANRDFEEAKARFDELTGEIARLEEQIADHGDAASIDEAICWQNEKAAAKAEVDRIEAKIAEQRAIIADSEACHDAALANCRDLESRHADLAAALVDGHVTQGEVEEHERAIHEARQEAERVAAEKKPSADRARQAIIGLERKLQEANAAFARQEKMRPEVLQGLIWTLAEKEGHAYYELAERLIAVYTRLTALGMLLRELKPDLSGNPVISNGHAGFYLPVFSKLSACEEFDTKKGRHALEIFAGQYVDFTPYFVELKNELRELGIQL